MISLRINGRQHTFEGEPDTPLLWVLRDSLGLTGTKYGCGMGLCGSCTVHLDGRAVRACLLPVAQAEGREVLTIEGLSGALATRLREAWTALQVPQCGYCQSGMLMSAAALLAAHPRPDDATIEAGMTNLCRCGTYPRVRAAIQRASGQG